MTVALVGTGPVVETVSIALEDVDVTVVETGIEGVETADLAVVTGTAGGDGFGRANDLAIAGGTPWIAVEVGGIGGVAVDEIHATVAAFEPGGPCFECLERRVEATEVDAASEPTADRNGVRIAGAYAGHLATRFLSGDSPGGVVIEIPHVERTLLPVPGCTCTVERERSFELKATSRSLEESIVRGEVSIDDRIGLIEQIGEYDSFPAPYYLSVLSDTSVFSDVAAPDRAAGVALDWDTAFMKATGESLERYSAAVYRNETFHRAPIEDVTGPSPRDFVRPDDWTDPDPETVVEWVPGRDLETGDDVYLPAGNVHFPSPDTRFAPGITTGLGLGNGTVEAIVSGLCEVIERDATMIGWYSTFEPLGLDVGDETFETLSRRAGAEGLSVTPTLVTQDIDVPVVTVAVHRDAWPQFAVGSAADPDVSAAAVSALAEALQNWMELREMGRAKASTAEGAIGRYADRPEGVEELLEPDSVVPAAHVGPAEAPTGKPALDFLLERMVSAGLESFAARITPRDVEQLGFEAVRVLVPEAQPLFVDEPLFGDRAREVPADLGFEPRLDRDFHPYP
ncbi:MAG: YcaO-like family protein [Halodesulfurarchaeum sp.]